MNDVKVSTFDMGVNERMVGCQGEGTGRNTIEITRGDGHET